MRLGLVKTVGHVRSGTQILDLMNQFLSTVSAIRAYDILNTPAFNFNYRNVLEFQTIFMAIFWYFLASLHTLHKLQKIRIKHSF